MLPLRIFEFLSSSRRRRQLGVTVTGPADNPLKRGKAVFHGTLSNDCDLESLQFHINQIEIQDVRYSTRGKLPRWQFDCELSEAHWNERGVVELEIRQGKSLLARANWRIDPAAVKGELPLVLFLHMPKCAGTSIRVQLERQKHALSLNAIYPEKMANLSVPGLAAQITPKCQVAIGHYPFGIHQYLNRKARYVTILRDPFQFLVSQYFFAKIILKRPIFVQCNSIYEAFEKAPLSFNNVMTRWLLGDINKILDDDESGKRACGILDSHFDYVGFSETMDETCAQFSRYFGIPIEDIAHNKTPPSEERTMLDFNELRERAGYLVRHDLEVYRYAQTRHRSCFNAS